MLWFAENPMSRTVPTYVNQIAAIEEKWSKFRRCLRREDQIHFDRLLRSVRYYTPSGMYQCADDPRESIILSILLDLQKRLAEIEKKFGGTSVGNDPSGDPQLLLPDGEAPTPE
jgi:hypothetical protein